MAAALYAMPRQEDSGGTVGPHEGAYQVAKKRSRKKKDAAPAVPALQSAPKPPATLGKYGVTLWKRLAPLLVELHLLTSLHLESLEALCDQWHNYQTHKIHLQQFPADEFFETESGYQQRSPRSVAREKAFDNLTRLWPKFGLTPESLKKIKRIRATETPGQAAIADALGEFAAEKYES